MFLLLDTKGKLEQLFFSLSDLKGQHVGCSSKTETSLTSYASLSVRRCIKLKKEPGFVPYEVL